MLSTLQVSINRTILYETASSLKSDAIFEAATISEMMLDVICEKNFGENAAPGVFLYRSDLTDVDSLGIESGEVDVNNEVVTIDTEVALSDTSYNDVDDYKGYHRQVQTPNYGTFNVAIDVNYVQESNTSVISNVQTYYKRIDIYVTHMNLDTSFVASRTRIYQKSK